MMVVGENYGIEFGWEIRLRDGLDGGSCYGVLGCWFCWCFMV